MSENQGLVWVPQPRMTAIPAAGLVRGLLDRLDVDGLRPLVAGLRLIGDAGALGQGAKAARLDRAVVDEEVLASLVRCDEAEALLVAEPLDGSGRHVATGPPRGVDALRTRRMLPNSDLRPATALPTGRLVPVSDPTSGHAIRCAQAGWGPNCPGWTHLRRSWAASRRARCAGSASGPRTKEASNPIVVKSRTHRGQKLEPAPVASQIPMQMMLGIRKPAACSRSSAGVQRPGGSGSTSRPGAGPGAAVRGDGAAGAGRSAVRASRSRRVRAA